MSKNLLLDSQLSKDSYQSNNSDIGNIGDWTRLKVVQYKGDPTGAGANFAAQFYKDANGSYKIAYRGTDNLTGAGDLEINKGILSGQRTPDSQNSFKTTKFSFDQLSPTLN